MYSSKWTIREKFKYRISALNQQLYTVKTSNRCTYHTLSSTTMSSRSLPLIKSSRLLTLINLQVEAELGKSSRTPSPPTIQTNPSKPNNGLVNGNGFIGINNSYPEQNGHVRVHNETNGHVHSETNCHAYSETNGHAYGDTNGHTYSETNGRVEKERRAQEYLDKIIPHKASDGGRIVRDILGSQK